MNLLHKHRSLFRKENLDAEMAEEMRHHVELQAELNLKAGMNPDEARYAALRQFGNVASIQEQAREGRGWVWLEQWGKDLGFALRALRHSPGFSSVAVFTLALGIGAGTAVFSLANGILLRSLPVPNPHELRVLEWTGRDRTMPLSGNYEPIGRALRQGASTLSNAEPIRADALSQVVFARLRDAAKEVADLVAFGTIKNLNALAGSEPLTTQGLFVSGNFFPALQVQMALGRGLEPADDTPGTAPVVVISHAWWKRFYGGETAVLGRTLTVNETVFTIVGVAPPAFKGAHPGAETDFFAPLAAAPLVDRIYVGPVNGQDYWWVQTIARLKPAASSEALLAATSGVFAAAAAPVMKEATLLVRDGRAGPDWFRADYRYPLLLLLAVVGVVMLVTCANLAGVCLARGEARRHEFAVRAALGAGRGRLVRVALLENLVLALVGAGLGIGLAVLGRDPLSALTAGTEEGLRYDTAVDLRVLGFSVAVALLTAILSGLLPGLRAARVDPLDALKRGGGAGGRSMIARLLVVLQISLALTVLVGAGLYGRSLLGLLHTDPGYRLDNRLVFRVKTANNANSAQRNDFHRRIQEALLQTPGIEAAAVASFKPMLSSSARQPLFLLPGETGTGEVTAVRCSVGESFFAVMDTPIVDGRGFSAADRKISDRILSLVVNEAFVRDYFHGRQAVGQQLLRIQEGRMSGQIIGVCRDGRLATVTEAAQPTIFFFADQSPSASAFHIIRSSLPKVPLLAAARAAVASVDPKAPLGGPAMLDEVRDKSLRMERLMATLVGSLGVLVLGLACLGVYGLMAFVVTRRTRDIGVRMALGARSLAVARAVLWDALRLAVAGALLGGIAALTLGRLIESHLYGISARDPWTLTLSVGVLLLGILAATLWPAWRAMRVNPLVALRAE